MLHPHHQAHLESSAISPAVIDERGYRSITPGSIYEWRQIAGAIHSDDLLKKVLHGGGLAFPLRRLGSEQPFCWILRPDKPRTNRDGKAIKYEYPKGTANILDLLPRYRSVLTDPSVDIWLTEGAKKADALTSAYGDTILPINENGVWGWRSKGKILDDFQNVVWEGRRVILAPDGDIRYNKAVYHAVQRTAKLLTAWGASEVLILELPCPRNGPKIGVDDYLGQGHSRDTLEGHLKLLGEVAGSTRVSLIKHPTTNLPLYLPAGYDVQNRMIIRREGEGAKHLYSGVLAVTEVGSNPVTKEESVTVTFDRYGKLQHHTLPRVALTSSRGVAEALGGAGANIHSVNAREVSRYLVEFIRENEEDLPSFYQIDRLGNINDGLVLPAGPIGLDREVRYQGKAVSVGNNPDIYPLVLREVSRWEGSLTTFWLTLALTLSSPILGRMRPDRNPILLLANASGGGKTTTLHFAQGAYGDARLAPLSVQCANRSTTPKGIAQNLGQVNGVPIHLEDVHLLMRRDPDGFAGLIYDFANGQLRSYGTLDQKGGGGTKLGGTLLMSGEAIPELQYEGSQRRLLVVNCYRYPPLGCEPKSEEGEMRAKVLTDAWRDGAGLFGYKLCDTVWANWEAFGRDVALLEASPALANLQAWRPLLATAAHTLRVALLPLGIVLDWDLLLRQWAALYADGQAERDPAVVAFDKVITMLSQSEKSNNSEVSHDGKQRSAPTWEWLSYERKMVAARRIGEDYWRVLTTSPQWVAAVGAGIVDMFGERWQKLGLIRTHDTKRPISDRIYTGPGRGFLQCILVPTTHLPDDEP